MMFSWSNMSPSAVHTGETKGWRLRAQNVNGSRLKAAWPDLSVLVFDPADAE